MINPRLDHQLVKWVDEIGVKKALLCWIELWILSKHPDGLTEDEMVEKVRKFQASVRKGENRECLREFVERVNRTRAMRN